ncbi:hypothetical protein FXO37_25808 [Capsicum annuum]|nr:hypothetical protein FXO37_25808 [Capsicum annuum]
MAGATASIIPANGATVGVDRGDNRNSASYVNSFRISAVADRLATHVLNQSNIDPQEFVHLCLSLARFDGRFLALELSRKVFFFGCN